MCSVLDLLVNTHSHTASACCFTIQNAVSCQRVSCVTRWLSAAMMPGILYKLQLDEIPQRSLRPNKGVPPKRLIEEA